MTSETKGSVDFRVMQIRVEHYEALQHAAKAKAELQFNKRELELIFYCIASIPLLAVEDSEEHLRLRNKICLAIMEASK